MVQDGGGWCKAAETKKPRRRFFRKLLKGLRYVALKLSWRIHGPTKNQEIEYVDAHKTVGKLLTIAHVKASIY